MTPTKSITERVCQALGFEGLALLICTPLLVWITGRPALEMGAVTLGLSLLALTWNIIFNSLFDRLKVRLQWSGGAWTRVLHALMFEGGLIIVAVPLDCRVAEHQPDAGVFARHRRAAVFPAVHLCVSLGV